MFGDYISGFAGVEVFRTNGGRAAQSKMHIHNIIRLQNLNPLTLICSLEFAR